MLMSCSLAASHQNKKLTLFAWSERSILKRQLYPLVMEQMMLLWFWKLTSVLEFLEKKDSKQREVQIMQLDNSSIWNLYFSSTVAKPIDVTLSWYFTISIKISCTCWLNSISVLHLHSLAKLSTNNLCTKHTILPWLQPQLHGMPYLTMINTEKLNKDLVNQILIQLIEIMTRIATYLMEPNINQR